MKTRTEILRAIAAMNAENRAATTDRLRKRTLLRAGAIHTSLVEAERDGLIEFEAGWWLTEAGGDQLHRDTPKPIPADLLLTHSDEGVGE